MQTFYRICSVLAVICAAISVIAYLADELPFEATYFILLGIFFVLFPFAVEMIKEKPFVD